VSSASIQPANTFPRGRFGGLGAEELIPCLRHLGRVYLAIHDETVRRFGYRIKASEVQIGAGFVGRFIRPKLRYTPFADFQIPGVLRHPQIQIPVRHFRDSLRQRETRQQGQCHQQGNGFNNLRIVSYLPVHLMVGHFTETFTSVRTPLLAMA
jgi:hypothetical protein